MTLELDEETKWLLEVVRNCAVAGLVVAALVQAQGVPTMVAWALGVWLMTVFIWAAITMEDEDV